MARKIQKKTYRKKEKEIRITPTQKRKVKRVALSSIIVAMLITFFTLFQIATIRISNSDFPTGNVIPTQDADTQSWQTYADNQYGFSFQYPSDILSVVDDSEPDRAPTPDNPEEIVDLRNDFFVSKGYEAPHPIYAVRVEDLSASTDHLVTPLSLWIFENRGMLTPDEWYEKYDYYPFAFAPHVPKPVDAEKLIQNVLLGDTLGKYHLRVNVQGGETAYVYVRRGSTMVLMVMDKLQVDGQYGNKILSTVRFFPSTK
ncbi:MAG: hypothetical protein KGJ07_03435 [Patescibacteria group bacterium]|nr:hypothetical protein [Patescibacteria group bacterium]MDE2588502.1 hypothetical protein [Patescibacteria group bacterium]